MGMEKYSKWREGAWGEEGRGGSTGGNNKKGRKLKGVGVLTVEFRLRTWRKRVCRTIKEGRRSWGSLEKVGFANLGGTTFSWDAVGGGTKNPPNTTIHGGSASTLVSGKKEKKRKEKGIAC